MTDAAGLAACPSPLPEDLRGAISSLAAIWAVHPSRPRLARPAVQHWGQLVEDWSKDSALPLFIRKVSQGTVRGEEIAHPSGRVLVATDNSPAAWAFIQAAAGAQPSTADVAALLGADRIPVAMVADGLMRQRARYRCTRVSGPTPSALGWKVCHKRPVGLHGRGPLAERPIEVLRQHFIDFLSPSNLFLVPLELAGLGELQAFIDAVHATDTA